MRTIQIYTPLGPRTQQDQGSPRARVEAALLRAPTGPPSAPPSGASTTATMQVRHARQHWHPRARHQGHVPPTTARISGPPRTPPGHEAQWCGVVWCNVVWCAWCGVVWCATVEKKHPSLISVISSPSATSRAAAGCVPSPAHSPPPSDASTTIHPPCTRAAACAACTAASPSALHVHLASEPPPCATCAACTAASSSALPTSPPSNPHVQRAAVTCAACTVQGRRARRGGAQEPCQPHRARQQGHARI